MKNIIFPVGREKDGHIIWRIKMKHYKLIEETKKLIADLLPYPLIEYKLYIETGSCGWGEELWVDFCLDYFYEEEFPKRKEVFKCSVAAKNSSFFDCSLAKQIAKKLEVKIKDAFTLMDDS